MLLNELNLKALCVSAESVLPVVKNLNVEGRELEFKITAFASGYGSGKKTVVTGSVECKGTNTKFFFENVDIEKLRRFTGLAAGVSKNGRFKQGTLRAKHKEITEVKKLSETFKTARAVFLKCNWIKLDTNELRAAFKRAREIDHENARKALQARAVNPLLAKIEKLSPEERALLLASLQ